MTPVSVDDAEPLPLAFSGQRLDWRDLPRRVRETIVDLAGAQVTAETSATSGFSPGFVAVLELADGRAVFVKAVSPRENPAAPDQARAEIRVARAVPASVPAPRLLWWQDDGDWVISGFTPVHGRTPALPWHEDDLQLVLAAVDDLSATRPLPGHELVSSQDQLAEEFTGWARLAAGDDEQRALLVDRLGKRGRWALDHLADLVVWEREAPAACAGDRLVHGDLRSDNVMIDDHRQVWLLDWPNATVGAPWLDLVFLLPSVAAEGGGSPADRFAAHPVSQGVDPDQVRAVLAGLAGSFAYGCLQDDPPGIPNLRSFQAAQARPALKWLRGLA